MKKGFTLAEVLITLAIIGVVAAMTVPTLMTSTRGKEYEVGGQKSLSTLANALQMRYAMDGQSLADYKCQECDTNKPNMKLFEYLTRVPNNARPGEQPALPTVQASGKNPDDLKEQEVYKLKDGMLMIVPLWLNGCLTQNIYYIAIDTNGEKGPTRLNHDTRYAGRGNNYSCNFNSNNYGVWFSLQNSKTGQKYPSTGYFQDGNAVTPANNDNPDLVAFVIDGHTNTIKPAGQRTKNILATGNALISR